MSDFGKVIIDRSLGKFADNMDVINKYGVNYDSLSKEISFS